MAYANQRPLALLKHQYTNGSSIRKNSSSPRKEAKWNRRLRKGVDHDCTQMMTSVPQGTSDSSNDCSHSIIGSLLARFLM